MLWDTDANVDLTFVVAEMAIKGRNLLVPLDAAVLRLDAETGVEVWRSAQGPFGGALAGKLAIAAGYGGATAYLAR